MVAKAESTYLKDDPKGIRDPARFKVLESMVFDEAISGTWTCMFYRFLRKHDLGNDERTVGNQYIQLVMDHRALQAKDPEELPEIERPLAYRRTKRTKDRYNEVRNSVIGFGRRILDPLLFEEVWPASEKEHLIAKLCLANLKIFFAKGTKPERKNTSNVV